MITEGREPFASAKAGYLRYRKVYAGGDGLLLSERPAAPIGTDDIANA